jgi:hypothetical protein
LELVDAPARGARGAEVRIHPAHPAMADPREMGLALTVRA